MRTFDRKTLAAFIAQHMDMGETEWYFRPDSSRLRSDAADRSHSRAHELSAVEPPPAPVVMTGTRSADYGAGSRETGEPSCTTANISDEAIGSKNSLDELKGAVCGCMRCPLGSQRTRFVFGQGNPDAGLMFIGEAPGHDEDLQGLAFVGRAGQLLTKMIAAIKLSRDEVFIGNILKCRPPGNRDPQAEEIEKCEPILLRQIEIIRPSIICALGRIAGQTLLRTKSTLGALRGKVHDYHGVKLVVTYHPAALLRNPNWKPMAWEDLKYLRREYDGMEIA
jgi:DNA polymerase